MKWYKPGELCVELAAYGGRVQAAMSKDDVEEAVTVRESWAGAL